MKYLAILACFAAGLSMLDHAAESDIVNSIFFSACGLMFFGCAGVMLAV